MGIKYKRDYEKIVEELGGIINRIEGFYEFLGLNSKAWHDLEEEEQKDCIKTMTDDLIYALGVNPCLNIGDGTIKYDIDDDLIKVITGKDCIYIVNLI